MKLCQFVYEDAPYEIRAGYILERPKKLVRVVDINKANPALPRTLIEILRKEQFKKVEELKDTELPVGSVVPLFSVALKAPITGMDKILCAEFNYKDSYVSSRTPLPQEPVFHSKFTSSLIGPSEYIKIKTDIMKEVDWGVHLAVVFSKSVSDVVSFYDPKEYILGYTVAQDIWARDWTGTSKNSGQVIFGRGIDTFCPVGPWIVTLDEIGFPEKLDITCSVNGVTKQKSNTSNLVHSIGAMIEHISSVMTLFPGDMILTGTPPGEGHHYNPAECLKSRDVITSEIQNIGVLTTRVVTAKDCSCISKTCYNKTRPL